MIADCGEPKFVVFVVLIELIGLIELIRLIEVNRISQLPNFPASHLLTLSPFDRLTFCSSDFLIFSTSQLPTLPPSDLPIFSAFLHRACVYARFVILGKLGRYAP
jgi:hypothetical protein